MDNCAPSRVSAIKCVMHSMNEAIEELGKVLYITEKRLYPIIREAFKNGSSLLKVSPMIGRETL